MAGRAVGVIWGDGHLRPLTNAHLGAGKGTGMSGDVQILREWQQEGHRRASAPLPVLRRSEDRRGTGKPSEGEGCERSRAATDGARLEPRPSRTCFLGPGRDCQTVPSRWQHPRAACGVGAGSQPQSRTVPRSLPPSLLSSLHPSLPASLHPSQPLRGFCSPGAVAAGSWGPPECSPRSSLGADSVEKCHR